MKALSKVTRSIKPAEVEKNWHLIDAEGLVLGRLAVVIANRENLQYDDETIALVNSRVDAARNETAAMYAAKLDSCESLMDALLLYRNLRTDPTSQWAKVSFKWRGDDLFERNSTFPVAGHTVVAVSTDGKSRRHVELEGLCNQQVGERRTRIYYLGASDKPKGAWREEVLKGGSFILVRQAAGIVGGSHQDYVTKDSVAAAIVDLGLELHHAEDVSVDKKPRVARVKPAVEDTKLRVYRGSEVGTMRFSEIRDERSSEADQLKRGWIKKETVWLWHQTESEADAYSSEVAAKVRLTITCFGKLGTRLAVIACSSKKADSVAGLQTLEDYVRANEDLLQRSINPNYGILDGLEAEAIKYMRVQGLDEAWRASNDTSGFGSNAHLVLRAFGIPATPKSYAHVKAAVKAKYPLCFANSYDDRPRRRHTPTFGVTGIRNNAPAQVLYVQLVNSSVGNRLPMSSKLTKK